MPYIKDENNNHITDKFGNKIEYTVKHFKNDGYKHKELIHINDDNNLDTEDRHIIIKEGLEDNHAVCKKQLDEINNNIYSKQDIDNKLLALENKITASINNLKSQMLDTSSKPNSNNFNNFNN